MPRPHKARQPRQTKLPFKPLSTQCSNDYLPEMAKRDGSRDRDNGSTRFRDRDVVDSLSPLTPPSSQRFLAPSSPRTSSTDTQLLPPSSSTRSDSVQSPSQHSLPSHPSIFAAMNPDSSMADWTDWADLKDSTDWKDSSLPEFESLEAALRCEVCKEFYDNPVLTACSHTFCSLCIRRCLSVDGKCPACRANVSPDKLLPNISVREVVSNFGKGRDKALELARQDKWRERRAIEETNSEKTKKRKLDETDIEEDEGDNVRRTRSRQTRTSRRTRNHRTNGSDDAPFEIPDSEVENEVGESLPPGHAPCPICKEVMLEEKVFTHLDSCPGEEGRRSTRSKTNNNVKHTRTFPNSQPHKPDSLPPPSRLPGFNYAMLKETALRKKLKELGIPDWGPKELLRRRHIEWLNIWNSNCDADETVRKSKRAMLQELNKWEKSQGGKAEMRENHIMKKDFDGKGYADTHKSDFDDLIANARKKSTNEEIQAPNNASELRDQQPETPTQETQSSDASAKPYENNDAALLCVRKKVAEANEPDSKFLSLNHETSKTDEATAPNPGNVPMGMQDPFASPSRKVPLFKVPEEPIVDVDSTAVQ